MESYALKGHGDARDYMQIIRELEEGYVVRIVRDQDGYEDVTTDFMSKALFESCIRTGYLTRIEPVQKMAVNA